MWLILPALLCVVLHDLEPEWPLFNMQDNVGGTKPHYAYYLCYRYPRPDYWVGRFLDQVLGQKR